MKYTINIRYNNNQMYHPITVTVHIKGREQDFHGKGLESLLKLAMEWIAQDVADNET